MRPHLLFLIIVIIEIQKQIIHRYIKLHLCTLGMPYKIIIAKKSLILCICNALQKPLSSPSTHELCFVKQLGIKDKDVNFI